MKDFVFDILKILYLQPHNISKPIQYKVLPPALGLSSSGVPVTTIDPDSIVCGDTLAFSK